MDSMAFAHILAGLMILSFIYMAFPLFCLVYNDGQYEKKRAKRIALWNSIIGGVIVFMILIAIDDWNIYEGIACPILAFLYYWINCSVLTDKSDGADTGNLNPDIVEHPTASEKETVAPKETKPEELILLYKLFYEKQKELEKENKTVEDIRELIEEIERK